jgi:hypothetical protein
MSYASPLSHCNDFLASDSLPFENRYTGDSGIKIMRNAVKTEIC